MGVSVSPKALTELLAWLPTFRLVALWVAFNSPPAAPLFMLGRENKVDVKHYRWESFPQSFGVFNSPPRHTDIHVSLLLIQTVKSHISSVCVTLPRSFQQSVCSSFIAKRRAEVAAAGRVETEACGSDRQEYRLEVGAWTETRAPSCYNYHGCDCQACAHALALCGSVLCLPAVLLVLCVLVSEVLRVHPGRARA